IGDETAEGLPIRHIHPGTLTSHPLAVQPGERSERAHGPAGHVDGEAQLYRRAIIIAGKPARATESCEHGSVAGSRTVWPSRSGRGHRDHHDVRPDLAQLLVAKSEAGHDAGPEILHDQLALAD